MSDDPALLIPDPVVADEAKLRRALGPVHLTMIGVGATIGAGIFVIAGTVSAQHAGPAVLLSFIIAATGCFFAIRYARGDRSPAVAPPPKEGTVSRKRVRKRVLSTQSTADRTGLYR